MWPDLAIRDERVVRPLRPACPIARIRDFPATPDKLLPALEAFES
jgi:hypothetical protein